MLDIKIREEKEEQKDGLTIQKRARKVTFKNYFGYFKRIRIYVFISTYLRPERTANVRFKFTPGRLGDTR